MLENFQEYILKIALTRSIFQPKMHRIAFGGRVPPGPAGGAYSSSQTFTWIKGSLLLREGDGKGVEVEGKKEDWMEKREEGGRE